MDVIVTFCGRRGEDAAADNLREVELHAQFSKLIILTANMESDGPSNGESDQCNSHLTSVHGIC
jgi:hypothetical protein